MKTIIDTFRTEKKEKKKKKKKKLSARKELYLFSQ